MSVRLPPLIPPHRYAPVEEGIHRGAYPKARNYRFLKRLKLRTILSLIPDAPRPELMNYCAENSIDHITLRVEKPKENVPWTYSKIAQALQICLDPTNTPLYVHCLDGANVTGMLVMCLRRLETWATPAAVSEFSRFSDGGQILPEEFTFLEKFSAEIELPAQLPRWLWNGLAVGFGKRHPTFSMKHLKFTNPDHIAERAEMFATGVGNAREERERRERETIRGEIMMGEYRKRVNADLLSDILGDKAKPITSATLGGPPILPIGLPTSAGQRTSMVATNPGTNSGSIGHHGSLSLCATPEDHPFRDASGILLRDDHNEVYVDTDSEEDAAGEIGMAGMSMTLQALALEGYTASGKDWD